MNAEKMDVNSQLHCLEMEAYADVLKAFIAQSDVLSWGKEGLITELRKELNINDNEHRNLLSEIDADASIQTIREWRRGNPNAKAQVSAGSYKMSNTSHGGVARVGRQIPYGQPMPPYLESQFKDDHMHRELPPCTIGNAGPSFQIVRHEFPPASISHHRGRLEFQSNEGFHGLGLSNVNRSSDVIKIPKTNKVVYKVERMICTRENLDAPQVEMAKSILSDHERVLEEAILKLDEVLRKV